MREDIEIFKSSLIVDESKDVGEREHMAIIVRFIDGNGFVRELFLDVVNVNNTTSFTLRSMICFVLSRHNLNNGDVRG